MLFTSNISGNYLATFWPSLNAALEMYSSLSETVPGDYDDKGYTEYLRQETLESGTFSLTKRNHHFKFGRHASVLFLKRPQE